MFLITRTLLSGAVQLLMLALLATGTSLSATPISGTLRIAGTAVVSLFGVDFVPPAGAGIGEVVVLAGGNSGDFAFLNAGFNTGVIVDRDATQPAGEPVLVSDWLMVPNFSFDLNFIPPGSFGSADCAPPAANAQQCTPPSFDPDGPGVLPARPSPLNLTNHIDATGNVSAEATFFVQGTVQNTSNPLDRGMFEGEFTATLLNVTFQDLIATVLAGGTVTAPFTATFRVTPDVGQPIPEPSSVAMGLGGMALFGAGLLRRRARSL